MKRIHCSGSLSSDGQVVNSPCWWTGSVLRTDGTNDATITVFDNASAASGAELIPSNTYDASALGLNGAMLTKPVIAKNGVYIEITCAGSCEVVPLFKKLSE